MRDVIDRVTTVDFNKDYNAYSYSGDAANSIFRLFYHLRHLQTICYNVDYKDSVGAQQTLSIIQDYIEQAAIRGETITLVAYSGQAELTSTY